MRILVIVFVVLILASLGSAFFYIVKDRGQTDRAVKALTVRIALSLLLFALLMLGFYFHVVPARGL
ncbi:MAG: twin transmembrane helix small protein [Betaproteobacteria bacterium]|nr:twin transmembrane helix small protein [Betaproteobacteria bacterium]